MDEAERLEKLRRQELDQEALEFIFAWTERLHALRENRGLSQDSLAFRATLGRNHVGEIERRQTDPRLSTLFKIAKALKVEVWELLKLDEQAT